MHLPGTLRLMVRRGNAAIVLASALIAAVLFSGYLVVQNRLARERFQALEVTDPPRYLDDLGLLQGFDVFLKAFRRMQDFAAFRPEAPRFLIGRWTMRGESVRLPPSGSFGLCENPMVIEYGHIEFRHERTRSTGAEFRLTEDGILEVRTPDYGIIPIRIVAYGAQIDHLRLTPPGAERAVYAYPCTA